MLNTDKTMRSAHFDMKASESEDMKDAYNWRGKHVYTASFPPHTYSLKNPRMIYHRDVSHAAAMHITEGMNGTEEVKTISHGAIALERRRDTNDVYLLTNNVTGSNYLSQEPNSFYMLCGGAATDSISFENYNAYPCCRTVRLYIQPKHYSCADTNAIIQRAMEKSYLSRFIHSQVEYKSVTADIDPFKHPHHGYIPTLPVLDHAFVKDNDDIQRGLETKQYVY